jgi:hypothetical protein
MQSQGSYSQHLIFLLTKEVDQKVRVIDIREPLQPNVM